MLNVLRPALTRRTLLRGGGCAVLLLPASVPCFGIARAETARNLLRYTYMDTRNLVTLVEDAAALVEAKGEAAFAEFDEPGSRWLIGDTYIFAYTPDGMAVFHPISPELLNTNVINLTDMDGKPIIQEIVNVANSPLPKASGWVFYLWQDRTQITPIWKASYVRKVVTPGGKTYLIGSGLYNPKIEKAFVQERLNLACDLLAKAGKEEAFRQFRNTASPFAFLDAYVFVLSEKGETLVDPAFPTLAGRDMLNFKDAVGFEPIRALFAKLQAADDAWVQFLWPKPGSVVPSRKLVYARKINVNGETMIVGSDFFIATPIWMKAERTGTWQRNQPG
jgi:signal transduction histidine kinase